MFRASSSWRMLSQAAPQRASASSSRLATAPSPSTSAIPQGWEAVIGVEVHAQLRSKNKLFSCACSAADDPHAVC